MGRDTTREVDNCFASTDSVARHAQNCNILRPATPCYVQYIAVCLIGQTGVCVAQVVAQEPSEEVAASSSRIWPVERSAHHAPKLKSVIVVLAQSIVLSLIGQYGHHAPRVVVRVREVVLEQLSSMQSTVGTSVLVCMKRAPATKLVVRQHVKLVYGNPGLRAARAVVEAYTHVLA